MPNLNNYFDFHVFSHVHVCLSVRFRPFLCARKLAPIPAVVQQNVTNKSCLVCVMSETYAFWVTLRPQSDCYCQGKAEVRVLDFKTTCSEFQKPYQIAAARGKAELRIYNLKKTSPTQSRSQAVVCISTPRMYPCSGYFLV